MVPLGRPWHASLSTPQQAPSIISFLDLASIRPPAASPRTWRSPITTIHRQTARRPCALSMPDLFLRSMAAAPGARQLRWQDRWPLLGCQTLGRAAWSPTTLPLHSQGGRRTVSLRRQKQTQERPSAKPYTPPRAG